MQKSPGIYSVKSRQLKKLLENDANIILSRDRREGVSGGIVNILGDECIDYSE